MVIVIDNWVNVISGMLSIVAVLLGGFWFLIERKDKKRQEWVNRFRVCEHHGETVKIKNLQNCNQHYKDREKVKDIFLEAYINPNYSEAGCTNHFNIMWGRAFPKDAK